MAETMKPTDRDNRDAPFGLNDDGTPLAPYGHNGDGRPRLSNRGPRSGGSAGQSTSTRTASPTKAKKERDELNNERKSVLLQLSDMFITTPLAALSGSKGLEKRIGPVQTDALAADAVIFSYFAPSLADGLIAYSEKKPQLLAWVDGMEDKAPLLMVLQASLQMGKAMVGNHMEPNPDIAKAGRRLARLNVAKMAAAINAEAKAMGIPTDDDVAAAMRVDASNAA